MAHNPSHARIGFYTARSDADLDAVLARAKDELVPLTREQTGFRRYTLVRTGPDTVISITGWDDRAQAEEAGRRLSGWVREVMGPALAAVESHVAEVLSVTEASSAPSAYARVTDTHFQPGKAEEVRARAQTEFLPHLRQQPGFIRHVAFRVGPERTMTFLAFGTREELEAAEEATAGWREYVAAQATGTQRHAGTVVWSVRAD